MWFSCLSGIESSYLKNLCGFPEILNFICHDKFAESKEPENKTEQFHLDVNVYDFQTRNDKNSLLQFAI